jgi:hypothetical protein
MTMVVEKVLHPGSSDRLFFTGMSLAAALTVFAGFAPTYYLRSSVLPPLSPLVHLHGLVFTGWIFLFLAQTTLVATRRTDLHRRLGIAGAILAVALVVVGVIMAIDLLRREVVFDGIDPRSFLSIPLGDMVVFSILVTAGIAFRRQAETHKRLMLLATITLLTAAAARIAAPLNGGPLIFFGLTDLFVAAAVGHDLLSRRRLHPATIFGGLLIVVFKPLLMIAAFTPPWLAFADALR